MPLSVPTRQLCFAVLCTAITASPAFAQARHSDPPLRADKACSTVGIDQETLGYLLNRAFGSLVGTAPGVPGSFGSLEIDKDQKATLAASSQPGHGVVTTVQASG